MTLRSLTVDQMAAVGYDGRSCLVLAPAGSGKTEVLIRRVIRELGISQGESFRILAVTYTRKAAEELRRRVRDEVGEEAWRVDADTVHGFALDWLTRFGRPVGVANDVVVYSDPSDRASIILRFLETLGEADIDSGTLLRLLDEVDGRESARTADDNRTEIFLRSLGVSRDEVREAYEQGLEDVGGIDFSQMLSKFRELLRIDESVLSRFQRTYRHLLVDEGQDLTKEQALLLRELVGESLSVFVVADDRQSINHWAGGGMEWARLLVGSDATELQLINNFRCSVDILKIASKIGQHFIHPRKDARAPSGAPRGTVELKTASTEEEEASVVATWLASLLTDGLPPEATVAGESTSVAPEEMGVIARNRYALEPIWAELTARKSTTSMLTDSRSLLKSSEGRLFYGLLSLSNNRRDRPAIRQVNEELGFLFPEDPPVIPDMLATTDDYLVGVRSRVDGTPIGELFKIASDIARAEDIDPELARLLTIEVSEPGWKDDVQELMSWWNSYRMSTRVQDRDLEGFLRYLFQMEQTRPDDPGIRLLTTHRAKGLEFRAVAVVGMAQGTFPDYRSLQDEADLDEERRAFYVAVTRASRALLLSWPRQRTSRYGRSFLNKPSQFLSEAGFA